MCDYLVDAAHPVGCQNCSEAQDGRWEEIEMDKTNGLGWLNVARSGEKVLGPVAAVILITPVFIWAGVKTLFSGRDGLRYFRIKRM